MPATKTARTESLNAAPATKTARTESPNAAPATKTARTDKCCGCHESCKDRITKCCAYHETARIESLNAAPATKTARAKSPNAAPATKTARAESQRKLTKMNWMDGSTIDGFSFWLNIYHSWHLPWRQKQALFLTWKRASEKATGTVLCRRTGPPRTDPKWSRHGSSWMALNRSQPWLSSRPGLAA